MKKFVALSLLILVGYTCSLSAQDSTKSELPAYTPGDHELFFFPTAKTLPKGSMYFSDYQLFFLNYGYAPTSTTHISVFAFFPISSVAFQNSLTIGVKQQVWVNKDKNIFAAVNAAFNFYSKLYSLSATVSIYNESQKLGIHGSLSTYRSIENSDLDAQILNLGLGIEYKTSKKISWIAEYQQLSIAQADLADLPGLVSIGLRWKGEDLALDFAGIRPTNTYEDSDILFYPFLKGTIIF